MIKQFMKMGGCKTKEEFYAKYPTEQSFFEAFPQAQMYVRQTGGGAGTQAVAQQQQAAAQQQQMINQYLQAYADMNGMTIKEVMRELQRLPEKQQQQALQEIVATVNQAIASQQQAASTGDMAAAQQAQAGEMPMDPQQAMTMAYGGPKSKLSMFTSSAPRSSTDVQRPPVMIYDPVDMAPGNKQFEKFVQKGKRAYGGAAPMFDDSIYRRPVPNFPRLFQTGDEVLNPGYTTDSTGSVVPVVDAEGVAVTTDPSAGGVEVTGQATPWWKYFTLGQTGISGGLTAAGVIGTGVYLGKKGVKSLGNYPIDVARAIRLSHEYDYFKQLAKEQGKTVNELFEQGTIVDQKTKKTLDFADTELSKLMAKIAIQRGQGEELLGKGLLTYDSQGRAQMRFPGLVIEGLKGDAAAIADAKKTYDQLKEAASIEAEKNLSMTKDLLYGKGSRQGVTALTDDYYKMLLKQAGHTESTIPEETKIKLQQNAENLAVRQAMVAREDMNLAKNFKGAVKMFGKDLNWVDDFDNSLKQVSQKWATGNKFKKIASRMSPKTASILMVGAGFGALGIGEYLDEKFGLDTENATAPQGAAATAPSGATTTTAAPAVTSQGSAAPDTLPRQLAYPFNQSGNTMMQLDVSDPNSPVYRSEATGDTTMTPEGMGYEPGYVLPKEYGGATNYGAFTVPYLMTGGTSAMPGMVMPDQVIDERKQTLMDFIKSHDIAQNQLMRRGGSSKKKI